MLVYFASGTGTGSGGPSRALALATLSIILLAAGLAPARAQLTEEDFARLRARADAEGWTFTLRQSEATEHALQDLCGLVEPPDWRETGRFDDTPPRRDLPPAYDWRDYNGCTSIRHQGGCGSCWAFAAIGSTESYLRIAHDVITDLSEQWLVSCTGAGSCDGGWHTSAFEYLRCLGPGDPCGHSGAVMESVFPYQAYDASCACPYNHQYCINNWQYVGDQWGIPSPAQLKQAIYDHGPVAVTVYANGAFHGYGGGIFNACEEHWVNHAVVLVGWDDTQGTDGVWIVRNSWGTGWGESGYMRIEYGCSEIGYAAAYVDYPAQAVNDHCWDAPTATNGTHTGATDEATNDGAASCGASDSSPDVWYTFTPAYDDLLTLDTCGSSYDTVLSIHTECPGSAGNEVACQDDDDFCAPDSQQSYLSVPVTAGNTYLIRVSGWNGATGDYSLTVTGPTDDQPPSPDPMTFETAPAGISTAQIEMVASEATDVYSLPIQYRFDCIGGGTGGTDSGWQTGRVHTDGGLELNTAYTYCVRARDARGNQTTSSEPVTGHTLAVAPGAVEIDHVGATSLGVVLHPGENPAHTELAIHCTATTDSSWAGRFVNAAGYPSDSPTWQSAADWGAGFAIRGLTDEVEYCWQLRARNGDGVETDYGPQTCVETHGTAIVVGRSCRTHGTAGEFCVELGIGDGSRYTGDNVEPRCGTIERLAFDVTAPVTSFTASVACARATAFTTSVATAADGSGTIAIEFDPPLPPNDCCTITFDNGVSDVYGVATLEGSVDEDLVVNTLDFSAVKARFGHRVNASNFRYDVNCDGVINTLDSSAIKARFGSALARCP